MSYKSLIRDLFSYFVIYLVLSVFSPENVEASTNYELGYRRASKSPRNLTSPNYPDPYPSNVSTIWWIYSNYMYSDIHIQFMFLDIEDSNNCDNDNLTIYQYYGGLEKVVEVCGNTTTHEEMVLGNDVIVVLKTNNNTEGNGFVIQYYVVEDDDSQDRDDYNSKGYTNKWGIAVIITCAIVTIALVAAVATACYCQRKQKRSNVQNIDFSDNVVSGDQEKPNV